MSILAVGRVVLHVFAVLTLLTALVLSMTALFTPAWQTTDLGTDRNNIKHHLHGLWDDCVSGSQPGDRWLCTNKKYGQQKYGFGFGQSSAVNTDAEIHQGEDWRLAALALLSTACALGILSLLFSFCAPCFIWAGIIWSISTIIAAFLSIASIIVFTLRAKDEDNAFVSLGSQIYDHHLGYSYYLGCGGCAVFAFAALFAIVTSIAQCNLSRNTSPKYADHNGKFPSRNTAI